MRLLRSTLRPWRRILVGVSVISVVSWFMLARAETVFMVVATVKHFVVVPFLFSRLGKHFVANLVKQIHLSSVPVVLFLGDGRQF